MVFKGRGTLEVNGTIHGLAAGSGFLLQPGDLVRGRHDAADPLTVFACHLRSPEGKAAGRLCRETLSFQMADPGYCKRRAESLVAAARGNPADPLRAKALLVDLLVLVLQGREGAEGGAVPGPFERLAAEVRSRPGASWTLEGMAGDCFLSVPQFTRRFRRTFGVSAKQFVIHERLRRAVLLLRETQLSIQQIAESLGYADHFFFHRQFKAVTGKTPSRVRAGASVRGGLGMD